MADSIGPVTLAPPASLDLKFNSMFAVEGIALELSPPGPAVAKQQVLSVDLKLDAPLPVLDYCAEPWP